jgi:hypothetical protein
MSDEIGKAKQAASAGVCDWLTGRIWWLDYVVLKLGVEQRAQR